jgi:spore germination cell wall hydrolase CwlJ-like protein
MDITGIDAPDLLALCVLQEAGNQPDDGQAAVARVVLNRTRMKYASDGTVEGTILHPNAFSWTEWEMLNRVYTKVATDQPSQIKRVRALYELSQKALGWAHCQNIAQEVVGGTYSGAAFSAITPDTVLYYNPVAVRGVPAWAKPENHVATIGAHWFYRDPPAMALAA